MLYDARGFEKIYVAPGYTDMRKGIDGLAMIIGRDLRLNPYQKNVLFLFCGDRAARSRPLSEKEMDLSFCTSGWRTVGSSGRGVLRRYWTSARNNLNG